MSGWIFPVALAPAAREPLFLQVERAVAEDIRRGRLGPGDPLPGSRTLARTLGVHRNTILAAYRELAAEGWIESAGRATRVARGLPAPGPGAGVAAGAGGLGFDLADREPRPSLGPPPAGLMNLAGGLPDPRLFPADLLARALRRALRGAVRPGPSALAYGEPQGELRLRTALAGLLAEVRGLAGGPERILVTGGSQMGLALAAAALVRPGDRVAVEDPGYPAARYTLRAAGAELVPVPVDGDGLVVEALERALAAGLVRAVYLTPHHQFPTTVTLGAARRLRLLELAARHRMAVLEDDYDFEFHFEGRPVLPLASADRAGVVVYLGTLSKVLAPGLRLGFLAAHPDLVARLAAQRSLVDQHGNRVMERAVAELLEDGLLQRHVRKVRRICAGRRAALLDLLGRHLGDALAVQAAPGGLSFWCRTAPGIEAGAWADRARAAGVLVHPARRFFLDGREHPWLRLGFSALDERELAQAVGRLAAVRPGS